MRMRRMQRQTSTHEGRKHMKGRRKERMLMDRERGEVRMKW